MVAPTVIAAFLAGIVSFLSPCVLPLIPGFLGFLAGSTPSQASRLRLFSVSAVYVLGFSVVFAGLGVLLNTVLEHSSIVVQAWLARIGGLVIIAFGLYLLGLIKIPWLEAEHKVSVRKFGGTYTTAFFFGAAFAVGWSPCVGAVLGSVLALAASQPGQSFALLVAYSLGLGVPFLLTGLFAGEAITLIKRSGGFLKWFNIVVGGLLIILGILVFTESLSLIASFLVPQRLLA